MTGDSAGGRPSTRAVGHETAHSQGISTRRTGGQRADGAGYQLNSERGRRLEARAREHLDAERAQRLIDLFDFSEVADDAA